ncbi:MAG: FG-GAP repeat domain-containing protein [Sandaracinaceae bacterium]
MQRSLLFTALSAALSCACASEPGVSTEPELAPLPPDSARILDDEINRPLSQSGPYQPGERIDARGADATLHSRGGQLGFAIAMPGDTDGDDLADLLVADYEGVAGEQCDARMNCAGLSRDWIHTLYGAADFDPSDRAPRRTLRTPAVPGHTTHLSGVGDVDGDGLRDYVVGIEVNGGHSAISLVYGGRRETGRRDLQAVAPVFRDREPRVELGPSTGVGDLNGDGLDDFVVSRRGRAYIVLGRTERHRGSVSLPEQAWATVPTGESLRLAVRVGDVDGDGRADLALVQSSPEEATFLWLSRVAALDGADGPSPATLRLLGRLIGGIGDIDEDGRDDVVVDASGDTRLLYGRDSWPTDWRAEDADATLVRAPRVEASRGCKTVSPAGDFDGDGHPDWLCGNTESFAGGSTTLVFGRAGRLAGRVELDSMGVSFLGATFPGIDSDWLEPEAVGASVAGGEDLNGDGLDDFVFADPTYIVSGTFDDGVYEPPTVGTVSVVLGRRR